MFLKIAPTKATIGLYALNVFALQLSVLPHIFGLSLVSNRYLDIVVFVLVAMTGFYWLSLRDARDSILLSKGTVPRRLKSSMLLSSVGLLFLITAFFTRQYLYH
jgi:hypothetical protein